MIALIPDLPPGTIGFRLSGTVTADDYRTVLEPSVEAAAVDTARLNVVVVIGDDLDRLTLGAGIQDAAVGLKERHEWGRIAVVSEHEHLNAAVGLFSAMARLDAKVFPLAREADAVAWASGAAPSA